MLFAKRIKFAPRALRIALAAGICAGFWTAAASASEKITYLLPAPPRLPAFAPWVLAKHLGYYTQAGYDVDFVVARGGVDVAKQIGNRGGGGGHHHSASTSPSPSSSPRSSTSGSGASPSASQPATTSGPQISLAAAHPQPAAFTRYALPALLILGGLSALAGSSALLGTSEGGIRGRLRALGAGTAALGRSAWTRVSHPIRGRKTR